MGRKAMLMHWMPYPEGSVKYTEGQCVIAVGIGDNKQDVGRAFALAGVVRLTSFFGTPVASYNDIVYQATSVIREATQTAIY